MVVWENVWFNGGADRDISIEVMLQSNDRSRRLDVIDSHIIIKKMMALMVDIIEPVDDIVFHEVNASGQSE